MVVLGLIWEVTGSERQIFQLELENESLVFFGLRRMITGHRLEPTMAAYNFLKHQVFSNQTS